MANLTITIDDDLLKRARLRALEQGTSVNSILRLYLENYSGSGEARRQAIDSLLNLSHRTGSGRDGRTWSRDELHER